MVENMRRAKDPEKAKDNKPHIESKKQYDKNAG
jgi:hypothetical protein